MRTTRVDLLIDSGADVTLVPRAAAERLGIDADPSRRYDLVAFDGTRSTTEAAVFDLLLCGRAYRGVYLLTDDERGILGRDVLNHLVLVLNGPARRWEIRS